MKFFDRAPKVESEYMIGGVMSEYLKTKQELIRVSRKIEKERKELDYDIRDLRVRFDTLKIQLEEALAVAKADIEEKQENE